jgi:FkbM family methyltransferase
MSFFKKWTYYAWSVLEIMGGIRNWPAMLGLLLRPKDVSPHEVTLREPPLRLTIRGAMDLWAVKETYLDEFYTRYSEPVQDGWTVVDIGAGVGDFAIKVAYSHPYNRVIAYEPFPGSFELLIRNLAVNAIANVMPRQEAVWRETGEITLDLSGGEPLQIASGEEMAGDRVKVPAVTLTEVLAQQELERIDLLKLDCEGAEYPILMEAPAETLAKVDRIIMEYHDLDEAQNYRVLGEFLVDAGYRVFWHANQVHADIGYLFATRVP